MIDKLQTLKEGFFNPKQDESKLLPEAEKKNYKNLKYYTLDFSVAFDNINESIIFNDIVKQESHVKKLVALYIKHDYFTKAWGEKILDQYDNFYHYQGYYYPKAKLKEWLTLQKARENTFIRSEAPEIPNKQEVSETPEDHKPVLQVSREAIRKITGYSPYVIPAWGTKQVYIEWQDVILQDESPIILVDGSRQIGKSHTIAEKAVELSFLPNQDTLVGGYIKKTTDVIRNYILKHTRKFPEDVFIHYKSEGYILNTKSGTKIYFRTLDNDAQNVLGLTLYNVIVDEAQLVDTYVYEEVLEPTLSTTNGRMILIGTPGRTAKGYYYDLIMEAKKGIEQSGIKIAVKSESNPDVSYYQIDITQNPLIAPRLRAKVMAKQDTPAMQRQYFCNWNSGEDQLFNPQVINEYPVLSDAGYFTITFDPAKSGSDRSAFCVSFTFNGVVYIILSGFMPKQFKKQWSKQIAFYSKGLIKQFFNYKNFTAGVDLRGVGEGFTEAFKNHYKSPNPSIALIEITYTSGDTETITGLEWKVSKTRLISNGQDMIDEGVVKIVKPSNKDLLEELSFLYEYEDNKGRIAMTSTFFDDISNAMLTNLFIVHQRNYIKRSYLIEATTKETLNEWNEDFTPKKKKKRKGNKKVW